MRGGNEFWFLCDALVRELHPFLPGTHGRHAIQGRVMRARPSARLITSGFARVPNFSVAYQTCAVYAMTPHHTTPHHDNFGDRAIDRISSRFNEWAQFVMTTFHLIPFVLLVVDYFFKLPRDERPRAPLVYICSSCTDVSSPSPGSGSWFRCKCNHYLSSTNI